VAMVINWIFMVARSQSHVVVSSVNGVNV
jgi:hypothetical protein